LKKRNTIPSFIGLGDTFFALVYFYRTAIIESMMLAERLEFLRTEPSNKGNGYRPSHTYGHGRKLEFRIPVTATAILSSDISDFA